MLVEHPGHDIISKSIDDTDGKPLDGTRDLVEEAQVE